ncbi:MAG: hypothetical protein U0T82_04240 [Bacteroidales bacterium]
MIGDLKKVSVSYLSLVIALFRLENDLFKEIVSKNLYVKNNKGAIPYEDAVLDFSNPATVDWYQEK